MFSPCHNLFLRVPKHRNPSLSDDLEVLNARVRSYLTPHHTKMGQHKSWLYKPADAVNINRILCVHRQVNLVNVALTRMSSQDAFGPVRVYRPH